MLRKPPQSICLVNSDDSSMGMNNTRCLIIASVLCVPVFPPGARSQYEHLSFERIGLEKGLSQSTVTSILQDRQGLMWFGTQDGLNRYDGYTFTVYRHRASDSSSLSDNNVLALCNGADGDIWVATENGGVNRYVYDQDKFIQYKHDPRDSNSIGGDVVRSLAFDNEGRVWMGIWRAGLDRFDPATGQCAHFRHHDRDPQSLSDDRVASVLVGRHGNVWVGTWNGLSVLDRGSGTFHCVIGGQGDMPAQEPIEVTSLAKDTSGILWIGTLRAGVIRYDPEGGTLLRFRHDPLDPRTLSSNSILRTSVDSSNRVWIGTFDNGLNLYDPDTRTFVRFIHRPYDPTTIGSDGVDAIATDRTGLLWIGTFGGGLSRYVPYRNRFRHYQQLPDTPRTLSSNEIRALCTDRSGRIWIGTIEGGLDRFDPATQTFRIFTHDPGNQESLSDNSVMALLEDHLGNIWIGTRRGTLDRLDPRRNRFTHISRLANDSLNAIMAISEANGGGLWIGTYSRGLYYYDPSSGKAVKYMTDGSNIGSNAVWAIHQDRKGDFWFGHWQRGISRYKKDTHEWRYYRHQKDDPRSLGYETVLSFYEDTDGFLWIGTWGGGLDRYDPRLDTFTHYSHDDGLPNDVVNGILPDGHGNLWLSTNQGLAEFNPHTMQCRNYDISDGLQSNEFNQGAYCRGNDGTLYFGGVNGLTVFQPDSIHQNSHVPSIVLTRFSVFGRDIPMDHSVLTLKQIHLSYSQDFFSLEFASLDYTAPEKNQYAYMLDGFDRGWIFSGTRRYASYTNLDPGDYTFKVKGTNNDGVWSDAPVVVQITIIPPFWRTWWFDGFCVMGVGVMLYAIYRYRLNKLLEMERLRLRLAADLHDELASNLSSIAMFSRIMQDRAGFQSVPDGSDFLERISSLAQESVGAIRDIIWAIDPKMETLNDLMVRLKDMSVSASRAKGIALEFDTGPGDGMPAINLSPEVRRNLWLLLKEAVHNAIKHSGCTSFAVRATYDDHVVKIRVADNGKGFREESGPAGKGLGTMRMRAGQIGARLDIDTGEGQGTTVTVTFSL